MAEILNKARWGTYLHDLMYKPEGLSGQENIQNIGDTNKVAFAIKALTFYLKS